MRHSNRERGQAAFFFMLAMVPLCLVIGLVVDVGMAYYTKISAQTAAQAAALAAVQEALDGIAKGGTYTCGSAQGLVCQAVTACPATGNLQSACLYANANGFANAKVFVDANTTNPPVPGVKSILYWVRVQIVQSNPLTFGALSGIQALSVRASATAAAANIMPLNCVVATDPTASSALSMSGNVTQTIQGCGIAVDSNSGSALTVNGSDVLNAPWIRVVGSDSIVGSSEVSPSPTTGVPAFLDPLEGVPAPQVPSGCDYTNTVIQTTTQLQPGTYCGGIKIGSKVQVSFDSGTYYLVGGGLNVSGNATLTGSGVTFYNTFNSTYAFAPFDLTGTSDITLSAPTSGPLEGMLFFEDRNAPTGYTNTITGTTGMQLTGAIYFPENPLLFTGNYPISDQQLMMVSDTITMKGNGDLILNSQPGSGAPIIPQIGAVLID